MKVTKTAKKSAKGWAGYKAAKGATQGCRQGRQAEGAPRPVDARARREDRRRRRHHRRDRHRARQDRPPQGGRQGEGRRLRRRRRHGGKDYDDVTLARKVETELFRPADVPKGSISVNVNDGVVELRGELTDQKQIDELGDNAKKIDGVKDVRNLLHTAGSTNGG